MRFEDLKKHLSDMTADEQADWFDQMSERRRLDGLTKLEASMKKATRKVRSGNGTKVKSAGKDKKIVVTPEQFQMLKALGLV